MAKDKEFTEVTFFIAVDENNKFGVDSDRESARDELCARTEGDCLDMYEVTVWVPKAKVRKVHLGTMTVAEDGASLTVAAAKAAQTLGLERKRPFSSSQGSRRTVTILACSSCHSMKGRFPLDRWPIEWLAAVIGNFRN